MVFYSYESVFCLCFQIRIIKGIEMDGKELLDGERSGSLYRNSHLAKLRTSGRGCPFVRIGESPTKALIRYRKEDLDEWLAGNTVRTNRGL